jgi:hypothetical protein
VDVQYGVGVEGHAGLEWRGEGQDDARVAFEVADDPLVAHVAADDLIAVTPDP